MIKLLVIRDSLDARFIINSIEQSRHSTEYLFALETGKIARKKFLTRMFCGVTAKKIPIKILDLLALIAYHEVMSRAMTNKLNEVINVKRYSRNANLIITDVNDKKFIEYINKKNINLIINYGTALYSSKTLNQISVPIVNIHSGILPKYRNVHSDFWAYIYNDIENIGITSFILNEKIDCGEILNRVFLKVKPGTKLSEIKVANLNLVFEEICSMLWSSNSSRSLGYKTVNSLSEGFWPTPGAKHIFKYFLLTIRTEIKKSMSLISRSE